MITCTRPTRSFTSPIFTAELRASSASSRSWAERRRHRYWEGRGCAAPRTCLVIRDGGSCVAQPVTISIFCTVPRKLEIPLLMSKPILVLLLLLAVVPMMSAQPQPQLDLMPMPQSVRLGSGQLLITQSFSIGLDGEKDGRVRAAATRFLQHLSHQTGMPLN